LFSQVESVDEIPSLLNLYEKIRRPRNEKIQKGALENGDIWHMPDGDDQISRDKAMKLADSTETVVKKVRVKNPNQWSDGDFQPWLFGHDAIGVAQTALQCKLNGETSTLAVEENVRL
jgi:salicylate hydroxylase